MSTVLIVDDEAPARRRLKELLGDCAAKIELAVVGEAENGHQALERLNAGPVDIVLLDIRMPDMDGIEVARHIQKLDKRPAIIFTTAYDAYAVKAFELNAVDYLLKPIRGERLLAALNKAISMAHPTEAALAGMAAKARTHLSVNERGRILLVPVVDILYMRAELKYVTLKTARRDYLIEESLVSLEQEFQSSFVRIHRNCLVARSAIAGFERLPAAEGGEAQWHVLLKGLDERLPVSRRQQGIVKEFTER